MQAEKNSMEALIMSKAFIQKFMSIDPDISPRSINCFLEIAMNEGINSTELAEKTGYPLTTVSSIVGKLSGGRPGKSRSYGLISLDQDPNNRRTFYLNLTERGRQLRKSLMEVTNSRTR